MGGKSLYSVPHGCPCGTEWQLKSSCRCTPYQIQRYRSKISGPLLDRIDIHIEVPPINYH
ncbi:ATP-binding protein, partial [bacterium]|nr:ATP-binding protein [bacterium]